jgi:predicted negative regulator of RcsB-dependent stress response
VASNLTRKELLKQDKFTVEAEHTVDYLSAHRKEVVRYGTVALVVIVLAAAVFYYRSSRASVREQILGEDIALANAPVGQAPPGGQSFPTQAAKNDAVTKAFSKLASDYSGSEEAYIAEYYLGSLALDAGNVDEARRKFQDAADHGSTNYSSLAKLSLAQLDFAQNRTSEAEVLLKSLMDHPTDLVSKEQAQYTLAKVIAPTRPEEARKLFQQLAGEKSDVSQIAQTAMNELPQK